MYGNATQQFNSLLSPTTIQTGQNELKSFLKEHEYFHTILLFLKYSELEEKWGNGILLQKLL